MSKSESLTTPTKYASPRLVIYGGMVALTAGGTKDSGENANSQGQGMKA